MSIARPCYVFLCIIFATTAWMPAALIAQESLRVQIPKQPLLQVVVEQDLLLSLEAPKYDAESDTLKLTLHNQSERTIIAWALEIRASEATGARPSITRMVEDHYLGTFRARTSDEESMLTTGLLPGARRSVELPLALRFRPHFSAEGTRTVRLASIVFADTTYLGDPVVAANIFADRGLNYRKQLPMLEALEKIQSKRLAPLAMEMELESLLLYQDQLATRGHGEPSRWRARIKDWLEILPTDPQQFTLRLESSIQQLRQERSRSREGTPSAFLHEIPITVAKPAISNRAIASCDLHASVARNTEGSCPTKIRETWNYSCTGSQSPPGSGTLEATGVCFFNTSCPPIFNPVNKQRQSHRITWSRTAFNQTSTILFPECTKGAPKKLELECPCPNGDGEDSPTPGNDTDDSPILLDLDRDGFELTGTQDPVHFDINADGIQETLSWTATTADDAFLVLDRNGDGTVNSGGELFGNYTTQPPADDPNGFLALAVFDASEHGGNQDGQISSEDAVFFDLLVWTDRTHDGLSQPEELRPLSQTSVQAIELSYVKTARRDQYGNQFRWSSLVSFDRGRKLSAVDVIFVRAP